MANQQSIVSLTEAGELFHQRRRPEMNRAMREFRTAVRNDYIDGNYFELRLKKRLRYEASAEELGQLLRDAGWGYVKVDCYSIEVRAAARPVVAPSPKLGFWTRVGSAIIWPARWVMGYA